jgi:hypothetical protein
VPSFPRHTLAVAGYALLAVIITWPLASHLGSHLPGSPSGDTGLYVWNLWVFRHEVIEHGRWPFFTQAIFALTDGADFGQHNYTPLADLLAFPMLPQFGPVATFNLLYVGQVALAGYALFLLALHVTRRPLESWLAGAVFAVSPVLMARSTAHSSLLWVAPLPVFFLFVLKYLDTPRTRYAAGAGLAVGCAALGDLYYGVYCVVIAVLTFGARFLQVRMEPTRDRRPWPVRLARTLDVALVCVAAVVVVRLLVGGTTIEVLGYPVHVRTLYTPVLVLMILAPMRLAAAFKVRLALARPLPTKAIIRFAAVTSVAGAVLLAPVLHAIMTRWLDGRLESLRIFWRSSPRGVDLLAFVLPNPNHQWFGGPFRDWIAVRRPDDFAELTASLSLVTLAVVIVALWRKRAEFPRYWVGMTLVFAALALGPFVYVAGTNTYVPGPWALLRYVPILGLARSPSRFVVLATLGLSVLFAIALSRLRAQQPPGLRRGLTVAVAAALAIELLPIPRPLHDATVPAIYDVLASDPNHRLRLLELPAGVRDGASSIGNFSARTQFLQTYHGKHVLGGYLSRVSARRKLRNRQIPMMSALLTLSEGRVLSEGQRRAALDGCESFLDLAQLGYVVIDRTRASPELRRFAVEALDLVSLGESQGLELYRPRHAARPRPPARSGQ